MKILGAPLVQIMLCFFITTLLSILIFLPAIQDFGKTLIGTEDMHFFIWLFWHYEASLEQGKNPVFADEIFYPYGASLSATSITPFQGAVYLLLPDEWGPFGKITFLQVLSYILGGIFSFALVYRFTKSFMPSMIGSVIYNFSVYHFEKAIHHLNWSMAFPFAALFFFYYFESIEKDRKKRPLVLLSLSLLLLALNEMTAAIMVGFIVFLDIFARYCTASGVEIFTLRNTVVLAVAVIFSLILNTAFFWFSFPPLISYTVPSAPFLAACLFILGPKNLIKNEKKQHYLQDMMMIALPTIAYLAFLSFQSSYPMESAHVIVNMVRNLAISVEYLLFPTNLQSIYNFAGGLIAHSETAVYLGIPILVLLALSFFIGKASRDETHSRNLLLLCLAFSFPILVIASNAFAITPFVAQPLFPLLSVLRISARFMLFALLFLSITIGLLLKRLVPLDRGSNVLIAVFLLLILVAERWPAAETFIFNSEVPQFYVGLAASEEEKTIFLYPDVGYQTLLNEVYYQTLHHRKISYGVLSRFPSGGNELFNLYTTREVIKPEETIAVARRYDYVVVQKLTCISECFYGTHTSIDRDYLERVNEVLNEQVGPRIFEDESIVVYSVNRTGTDEYKIEKLA